MKSGGLIYVLAQRSERERGLLLMLGTVILPLAIVFLAVLPQMQARDATRVAAFEAEAMLAWVSEQVRALPAEGAEGVEAGGVDPIGISGIEESLVRADLRAQVSKLSNRDDDGVDLALEAAPFAVLSNWLQAMVPNWGYRIAAFRIEAASPGLVNATFELEAAR